MDRSAGWARALVRLSLTPAASGRAEPVPVDTIFAHSSGRPPAAIAVIRISGPGAHSALKLLSGSLPPARQAKLRRLRGPDGVLDEALVLRFDAPASATGEDLVELHCHAGRAVVDAVLRALQGIADFRAAEPGEFTRRALANGRIDLTEAEGLADLLEAETESQRRAALAAAGGAIRRQVQDWAGRLVILSARAEAAIDYVGDDDETAADGAQLAQEAQVVRGELLEWLAQPRVEPLREGIKVVLAGPPNSGKSSLLNALAGDEKAIVTPIEGTTRDAIEVPVAIAGVPFVLVDTAGLRACGDVVESIGVERAEQRIQAADILLWLGEVEAAPDHSRMVMLHSRADLPERRDAAAGTLPVSSVTGEGLTLLKQELVAVAGQLLPGEGAIALNARQGEALQAAVVALDGLSSDVLLTAEALRQARAALDRVMGRAGIEDVLDALFGRFCLGK